MRLFFISLTLSFICHLCFSQPFSNERTARDYFSKNIGTLDPIEGVYDIENKVVARAGAMSQTHRENYTIIICQSSSNKFSIYDVTSGGKAELTALRVERLGESSFYKMMIGDKKSIRFELEDLFSFKYSYNDSMGIAVSTVTFTAYKKYPTRSLYVEAIEKEAEEAARKKVEEQARIQEEEARKAGWTGTGFALSDGYIVTNYHVIDDATNISIKGVKGDFNNELTAQVVASDKFNDIAILKINDSRFSGFGTIPYLVKTSISDVAEDIFVLGYPLTSTMGDEIKYTTGVISSKTGFQGDVSQYQISAPVQPGNSGGPLFDAKGNVIGIVSAKHNGAENVGYAIKTSYLKNLIDSVLPGNILPTTNSLQTLSNAEKVKKIKPFVFLINANTQITTKNTTQTVIPTPKTSPNTLPSTTQNTSQNKIYPEIPRTLNIAVGGKTTLKPKEGMIGWSTKDNDIVYLDRDGNIEGRNPGSAKIYGYTGEGQIEVTVIVSYL